MSADPTLQTRVQLARRIAVEAGALARHHFENREAGAFELKGHQDYLTEADGAVERFITERINDAFPGDFFLGEEGGGEIGEHTWIVDPIDGTANFARGMPHFCVSIAYVRAGQPCIGAIHSPMTSELFFAVRGEGATLNDAPMKVSRIADMKQATVELGWSMRRPMSEYIAMIERVTRTGAGFRRAGSGALGLAYVAAGRIEGYAELHINSWDTLAGLLMVREAGGWTNDFLRGDGLRTGNPVLACTPALTQALVTATGISP